MEKKKVIFVILIILIVLGLINNIIYKNFYDKKENKNINKDILLKDKNKDVVYNYINKKLSHKSDNCDKLKYIYKIPQVNIDSKDADFINKEILSDFEKIYIEDKKTNDDKSNINSCVSFTQINYKYFINKDILSLVVYTIYDNKYNYYTYNINIKNGVSIYNTDLLEYYDLNEDSFKEKLVSIFSKIENEMNETNNELFNNNITSIKDTSLDKYNMYLDKKGILNVIYKKYGNTYAEIINIDYESYVNIK